MYSKMQKDSRAAALERPQRAQASAPDHHHLARLDVALEGRTDQIERAGLARRHPGAVEATQRQGPEAARVARRDQRVVREREQAEGALHARERVDEPFFGRVLARAGEQLHDHLAVGGGAEDRAAPLELAADRDGVDEIAVVRDRDRARVGAGVERLRVAREAAARRRVAHVADRVSPREPLQDVLVEDVGDEAHAAVHVLLVRGHRHDARALLAAVLKGVEPEIGHVRGLGVAVDAEHAALVVKAIAFPKSEHLSLCGSVEHAVRHAASRRRGRARDQIEWSSASAASIHAEPCGGPMRRRAPPVVPMRTAGTPAARACASSSSARALVTITRPVDSPNRSASGRIESASVTSAPIRVGPAIAQRASATASPPRDTSCALSIETGGDGRVQQAGEAALVIEIHGRRMPHLEPAAQREPLRAAELLARAPEQHDRAPRRPQKWDVAWRSQGSSSPTTAIVGVGWIARPEVSL